MPSHGPALSHALPRFIALLGLLLVLDVTACRQRLKTEDYFAQPGKAPKSPEETPHNVPRLDESVAPPTLPPGSARPLPSDATPAEPPAGDVALPNFTALFKTLSPTVVNVFTSRPSDDFMPRWRSRNEAPRGATSLGTGFVVDPAGLVLTNHHVIEDATEVRVRMLDGAEYEARIVGDDAATDVAVLQLEAIKGPLPAARLGDSDALQVGEWVLAIGNPFGLGHTLTKGIVSAKGRNELQVPLGHAPGSKMRYASFIQTDAAINPGNSGGPLFNLRGEVIGINTAIRADANNIGFAIPISMVKRILPELRIRGRVERAWLGVGLGRATSMDDKEVRVAFVQKGSPADMAGLRAGDVIIEFDGHPVSDVSEFRWLVATSGVGREVEVAYTREGTAHKVQLKLAKMAERME